MTKITLFVYTKRCQYCDVEKAWLTKSLVEFIINQIEGTSIEDSDVDVRLFSDEQEYADAMWDAELTVRGFMGPAIEASVALSRYGEKTDNVPHSAWFLTLRALRKWESRHAHVLRGQGGAK